jgi:hypothetical protein
MPSLVEIAKPPNLKGMQTLNREAFNIRIPILSARVKPEKVSSLRKHPDLKGYVSFLRSYISEGGSEIDVVFFVVVYRSA